MRINHNLNALNAWYSMYKNNQGTNNVLEKLSTGLRINRAADDAAGLAISEKMRTQIAGLDISIRNAQDGISLIQTAEGALQEVHSMLQRMRELSIQAATDTNTEEDRAQIQKEIDQLIQEIDRIGQSTEFNTRKILTGRLGFDNSTSNPNVVDLDSINAGSAQDGKFGIQFSNPFANHETTTAQAYGEFSFKSINGETLAMTADGTFTIVVGTASKAFTAQATENVHDLANEINGTVIGGVTIYASDADNDGEIEIWASKNFALNDARTTVAATGADVFVLDSYSTGNYTRVGSSESKRFDSGDTDSINPETTNYIELTRANTVSGTKLTIYVGGQSKQITTAASGLAGLINAVNGTTVNGVTIHAADLDGDGKIEIWASKKFDIEDQDNDAVTITDNWIGNNDDYVSPMVLKGVDMGDGSRSAITLVGYTVGQMTSATFNANTLNNGANATHVYARDLDGDGNIEFYANKAGSDYSFIIEARNASDVWTAATYTGQDTLASKAKVEGTNAITDKIGANGFLKINGVAVQIEEKDDLSTIIAKINQKSTLTGVIAHDNDGDQKLNLEQTNVGSKNKIQISGSNEVLNALGFDYTTVYGEDVKIGYNTSGSTDTYEVTVQGDEVNGSSEPINYAMTDGNHVLLGTDAIGGSDSADGSINERKGALLNFDIMPSFTLDSISFKDSLFDANVETPYSSSYEAYRNDTQHIEETVNINGGDSLKLHIGPNSDELLKIKIDDMSSFGLGISGLQVTTQQAAESAIKKLDFAIEKVSTQRSSLGAYQNRLEHTINNLGTENQNLTAAESRIRDADMAKEMMVYTKYQVLVQSSMSMLAQANQLPKQILQLLRG